MQDNGSSQAGRSLPAWFDEAKLGLMVVWTPASVPAFASTWQWNDETWADDDFDSERFLREAPFAEMYFNSMQIPGSITADHHARRYGDAPYEAFAEEFRAGLAAWDPEPWADLFEQTGARYVVLVAKHQDGFLLWPSATPNPHKDDWQVDRDVVGELAASVRARGMRFGVLYTGGTDLSFSGLYRTWEEMQEAIPQDEDYAAYVDAHWRELIERYQLDVAWNDMGYPAAAAPAELVRWYREQVPEGVTNDRFAPDIMNPGDQPYTDFFTLEYQRNYERDAPKDKKWESCRGVAGSFGYNREETDADHATPTDLIQELVDCVAHGGNLLLAVGPSGSGAVPWPQLTRLRAIGWWLRENGAAIYSTRPWERVGERTGDGLEVRYTCSDEAVYAILLGTPAAAAVELDLELAAGASVDLLAGGPPLEWAAVAGGVRIELPEVPAGQPALALRLGPADAVRPRG